MSNSSNPESTVEPPAVEANNNGHGHGHTFEPCSCCRALAQVRMPVFDSGPVPGGDTGANGDYRNNGGNGTNGTNGRKSAPRKPFVFGMPKNHGKKDKNAPVDEDGNHDPIADLLPKKRRMWQGLDGFAVMTFGVLIPTLMALACSLSTPKRITLLLLNHPLETSVELLLIFAVPLTVYVVWSSICKDKIKYGVGMGLAMGASIGSALFVSAVCIAALFWGSSDIADSIGTEFTTGFCWLAFLAAGAALTGVYLVNRIRLTREFTFSRMRIIGVTAAGVALSVAGFVACEARPWSIRLAERKAISTKAVERTAGLQELRALGAERELRMECSDNRAAGIAGLFIPIKAAGQREIYFAMTGKPYNFREFNSQDISNMADEDLKRNIVGEKVPGLSLIRSALDGVVHAETLTSTLNWTFVFKNGTTNPQEMRSELALPPGAVVTGLTLWRHGEPQEAIVAAAGKAEGYTDARWQQVNLDSPATISDLGHGRMLLHCNPVLQDEEMKVAVRMVVPLKPDGAQAASLTLPTFLATNFKLKGFNHTIKIHSSEVLKSTAKNLAFRASGTDNVLDGSLADDQLETANLTITAARKQSSAPVVVLDKVAVSLAQEDEKRLAEKRRQASENANAQAEKQIIVMIDGSRGVNNQVSEVTRALNGKPAGRLNHKPVIKTVPPSYVVENFRRVAAPAPRHLVVVVDGSAAVKPYAAQLAEALTALPAGIKTEVVIASQEAPGAVKGKTLATALPELAKFAYVGGQNNLQSVVNAAEVAGEQAGGAVLWVHGPQPALNEEIYIMSKYVATPAFYELQVGTGNTDAFDFFKNHSEIGPFIQVPKTAATTAVREDLSAFFAKWQPNSDDYAVSLAQANVRPDNAVNVSDDAESEILALNANRQCAALIATRHIRRAARVALAYGIVSPVSCALISEVVADVDDSAGDSTGGEAINAGVSAVSSSGDAFAPSEKPTLLGATNGTIGSKAAYVTGVNTAGTVRVNNLANLEALLNIIANLAELACALCGFAVIVVALARREPFVAVIMGNEVEFGTAQKIGLGLALIVLGLMMPGLINWFVASARDANLFS